jgi:hypothetical protein
MKSWAVAVDRVLLTPTRPRCARPPRRAGRGGLRPALRVKHEAGMTFWYEFRIPQIQRVRVLGTKTTVGQAPSDTDLGRLTRKEYAPYALRTCPLRMFRRFAYCQLPRYFADTARIQRREDLRKPEMKDNTTLICFEPAAQKRSFCQAIHDSRHRLRWPAIHVGPTWPLARGHCYYLHIPPKEPLL